MTETALAFLDIVSTPANFDEAPWLTLPPCPQGCFDTIMPPMRIRLAAADMAEAVVEPSSRSMNAAGGMHGAYLAAVAEITLFVPLFLKGSCTRAGNVTVDFTLQYLAGGDATLPLHARIELLRETGRMGFVRGTLLQQGVAILAYSGTLRKLRI